MPKTISLRINEDGTLDFSEELIRDTIGGIVRDVHVVVDMEYRVAARFRDWLHAKINEVESSTNVDTIKGKEQ